MAVNHDNYASPFSWRYGSREMRAIWSEVRKRRLMRRVWVALAEAQHRAGVVTAEQLEDLRDHQDQVDPERSFELEKELRHDVMAEIAAFREQCGVGGRVIHWGATSADITDNVDALRIKESAKLLRRALLALLHAFAAFIEEYADLVVMAYTHIQPAEPTTSGYRFAMYAQDLYRELQDLERLIENISGKGFKGAVGTQASFAEILAGSGHTPQEMEAEAMALLDLPYFEIAGQTYPRSQDLAVLNLLASIAAILHKFALDLRILQSPAIGEMREPFGSNQVGSSAMPFKQNPVGSENICSLARYVGGLPAVAWNNAAQNILERTLDDSANRRIVLAEAFLGADELLERTRIIVDGIRVNHRAIARNLEQFGPFAATERLLVALVRAGADRQEAHEWLRELSLEAAEAVRTGKANPLQELIMSSDRIGAYLNQDEVGRLMDASGYIGTAEARARAFAEELKADLASRS